MKNEIMSTLYRILMGQEVTPEERAAAQADLEKDLNRTANARAEKVAEYEAIREVVFKHLGSAPMTLAELFAACESELPAGTKKGQVQYGLTHYWTDEIVKIENAKGANEYRRA